MMAISDRVKNKRGVMVIVQDDEVTETILLPTLDRAEHEFRIFFKGWLKDCNEVFGLDTFGVAPPKISEIRTLGIDEMVSYIIDQGFNIDVYVTPIDKVARPIKKEKIRGSN